MTTAILTQQAESLEAHAALPLTALQLTKRRYPRAYTTELDEFAVGEDGDNEVFADLAVVHTYSPAEPMTRDYPGCPAEIEVLCTFDKHTGAEIELDEHYTANVESALWAREGKG